MKYLTFEQILFLHNRGIQRYGGSYGFRGGEGQGLLESALARPMATAFGKELYPTLFEKAASLAHSLIHNHPFLDGNKRAAFYAMALMFEMNGYELTASSDAAYRVMMKVAKNEWDVQKIAAWLRKYTRKLPSPP